MIFKNERQLTHKVIKCKTAQLLICENDHWFDFMSHATEEWQLLL